MFEKEELEFIKAVLNVVQVQGIDNAKKVVSITDKIDKEVTK